MKIAIDASRAFLHERTGIEEYSYQLIKHLVKDLADEDVTLFLRSGTAENVDFVLPEKWKLKQLYAPRLWTYVRLSLAMLFGRFDRLFVPGHIVPPIHPRTTIATIHGLEFEMTPEAFSPRERRRMRYGIKKSCKWSRRIICVSNNTKKDLMRLYHVPQKKIRVIYEGVNPPEIVSAITSADVLDAYGLSQGKYLLFIGRIEIRKNITAILQAYEMLREHFHITQKLVLAGKGGYGYDDIVREIHRHPFKEDIILTGFISAKQKSALLAQAGVFVFPSLYEGFGLTILEAQHCGVPVVTASSSSLGEIAKESALLVDPHVPADLAEKIYLLLSDEDVRNDLIKKGTQNVKRFSWERAAELTAKMIRAR